MEPIRDTDAFFHLTAPSADIGSSEFGTLRALVNDFGAATVLVARGGKAKVEGQLRSAGLSKSVRAVGVRGRGHTGRTLLAAARQSRLPKLLFTSDAVLGPVGDSRGALEHLARLPGPVASLFGVEAQKSPLNLGGGVLLADRAWLRSATVQAVLRQPRAHTWFGLGRTLQSLLSHPVPAVFPLTAPSNSLGASQVGSATWLASGLAPALSCGTPFVPWSTFTANPLALASVGVRPAQVLLYLRARGMEEKPFWDHLLSTTEPQVWHANLGLLTITDPLGGGGQRSSRTSLRTAVIMHVFYPEMLEEMVGFAANVPPPAELFITTDTAEKATLMRSYLTSCEHGFKRTEVRVVKSNRGRDIPAFLIDCADVIRSPRFDLIVKLHSKKSAQTPPNLGEYFKDHLFQNLVGSPSLGYQIRELFEKESRLGLVFPPMIHSGYPTMGNGWMTNKLPAFGVARRLGFELLDRNLPPIPSLKGRGLPRIPADSFTPLAPYGSMFWARREALLPLVDAGFQYREFPDNSAYLDGSLAHVLERLTAYTAYSRGFYARTVQTIESAQTTEPVLAAKLTAIDRVLPLPAQEQIDTAASTMPFSVERSALQIYAALVRLSPAVAKVGKHAWFLLKNIGGLGRGRS